MAKRNKGIYKRGRYYWICYAGLDGKIERESTKSTKVKDAQTLLEQRKQEIRQGKQPFLNKIGSHTFKELADEYARWAERQRGIKQKQYVINQLVKEFTYLPLRRFNSLLLEQYQTTLLGMHKKPATINRHLATLKHMFTKAVEWDMVEEEILKRIRKAKLLEENNMRLRYLSVEECQELITCCSPHLRPIVITALHTGMRKGEIFNLQWDKNVDMKHGFILLEKTKNGNRREIPIDKTLRETLKQIIRRLDVPYVFHHGKKGTKYRDIRNSFDRACVKAGIPDFHFHDLRHTHASHLVMNGVDLATVQKLLGHKTYSMTLRYAHLAPSHLVRAVNTLDNALNISTNAQKVHNYGE